jgi:hypothetical protein
MRSASELYQSTHHWIPASARQSWETINLGMLFGVVMIGRWKTNHQIWVMNWCWGPVAFESYHFGRRNSIE